MATKSGFQNLLCKAAGTQGVPPATEGRGYYAGRPYGFCNEL
jgi:hypothetical protein